MSVRRAFLTFVGVARIRTRYRQIRQYIRDLEERRDQPWPMPVPGEAPNIWSVFVHYARRRPSRSVIEVLMKRVLFWWFDVASPSFILNDIRHIHIHAEVEHGEDLRLVSETIIARRATPNVFSAELITDYDFEPRRVYWECGLLYELLTFDKGKNYSRDILWNHLKRTVFINIPALMRDLLNDGTIALYECARHNFREYFYPGLLGYESEVIQPSM